MIGLCAAAACTPAYRFFDLVDRPYTCAQANDYAYRTMQTMQFDVSGFQPAAVGRPGELHGSRKHNHSTQTITVAVTCQGSTSSVIADEDGAVMGRTDFKRAFYLTFLGIASRTAEQAQIAAADAARPLAEKRRKGLEVLLEPLQGQSAKLDFSVDFAAAGVLPVRVTVNNVTNRAYRVDPTDVVLVRADGTRVPPMSVGDAAARVNTPGQPSSANAPVSTGGNATQQLQAQLFTAATIPAGQVAKGFLFFPLGSYVGGRVSVEDTEIEESEGFVVQF